MERLLLYARVSYLDDGRKKGSDGGTSVHVQKNMQRALARDMFNILQSAYHVDI